MDLQQQAVDSGEWQHEETPQMTRLDFAESQPEWGSAFHKAMTLVLETETHNPWNVTITARSAFHAAQDTAVDAVLGKREPTLAEVRASLGFPKLPETDELPF